MALTADQIARRMLQRRDITERAFRQSSNGLAVSLRRYSAQLLTEQIYAIPEDRTKSGKKKWRRTGHLRRSERVEVRDPYTVVVVNDARYARPRHDAGKPGHRNINPARVSHWRDDLEQVFRPIVLDLRRQTVLDILQGKG